VDKEESLPPDLLTRRDALVRGATLAGAAVAASEASAQHGHEQEQMYPKEAPDPGAPPKTKPVFSAPRAVPERPWARAARAWYPPGMPGRDYTPVFVPNGSILPFRIAEGGVKIFHLVAEETVQEVIPGVYMNVWGYNGQMPGPCIEVSEGDRVRIYVTNHLPVETSVHWHGLLLPNGMDGVSGITQPAIVPGRTGVYEYIFPDPGTFMYHSHFDDMTQEGMGLTGMIVVHPRDRNLHKVDRDFVIMLHEWRLLVGASRPNPFQSTDFNVLTMNGVSFPLTYPLVAQLGDKIRIRLGNLSPMDHHPIHLHGYRFNLTETGGGRIPDAAQWPLETVLVPVGTVRVIELLADNPGDWIMHCHMTHHTMNQMGHDIPNMVDVEVPQDLEKKLRQLLPGYMTMGQKGMAEMAGMMMPVPENSGPMTGFEGKFGPTVMGGMVTILKVRDHAQTYEDPGLYEFPEGTVMGIATEAQMAKDGIQLPEPAKEPQRHHASGWKPPE